VDQRPEGVIGEGSKGVGAQQQGPERSISQGDRRRYLNRDHSKDKPGGRWERPKKSSDLGMRAKQGSGALEVRLIVGHEVERQWW
jgi:hypothetical protein